VIRPWIAAAAPDGDAIGTLPDGAKGIDGSAGLADATGAGLLHAPTMPTARTTAGQIDLRLRGSFGLGDMENPLERARCLGQRRWIEDLACGR
jgi:hypothetical protein